jgi:hypothetical protein
MVANPHSSKSDRVMEALENRENPIPDNMMQEILLGRDTIGQKEILEAEYSNASFMREMVLNRLISLYRSDTLNDNTDSIFQLLADYNTLPAKYRLMMIYFEENDSTEAKDILQNIPQQFELNSSQALVNDHWNDYLDLLIEIKKDSLLLPDLDSLHIQKLDDLAQFDDQPGCLAENILHFMGRMEVSPVYILPEDQLKSYQEDRPIPQPIQGKESYIKLYPNPAKNYIVAEYDINECSCDGSLLFYDSTGKLKFKIVLDAQKNDFIINTKDWTEGIYLYNFTSDDQHLQSGKLIIAK